MGTLQQFFWYALVRGLHDLRENRGGFIQTLGFVLVRAKRAGGEGRKGSHGDDCGCRQKRTECGHRLNLRYEQSKRRTNTKMPDYDCRITRPLEKCTGH